MNRFRFTLTNLADSSTDVLTNDPIGWDDAVYKMHRDERYNGIFQDYTSELKFHCDGGGKQFIDAVYEAQDIDGRITVKVEIDCDGSGTYSTLFEGLLNLASYSTDGQVTTVNIEKNDLLTKLTARDEIDIDIESTTSIGGETITAPATYELPLSQIDIEYLTEWAVADGYTQSATGSYPTAGIAQGMFVPLGSQTNVDDFKITQPLTEFSQVGDGNQWDINEGSNYIEPILKLSGDGINTPITVNYAVDFDGTLSDSAVNSRGIDSIRLVLGYGKRLTLGGLTPIVLYDAPGFPTGGNPTNVSFNISETGSFTLHAGEEVYLYWVITWTLLSGSVSITNQFNYNRSTVKLSAITSFDYSTTKAQHVHEAFNQVVDAIADSNGNFYSEFYGRTDSDKQAYAADGCGSMRSITNGLNIRKFQDKKIYCNLADMFDSLNAIDNIGLGLSNGKIRVEPLAFWYDNSTQIIELPYVADYIRRNDNSRYFNKVEIGYDKWETEFKNGIDEPCTKHQYSTKVASAKGGYRRISKFIASSYAIELTRRKKAFLKAGEPVNNEDWKYDNDNFIIQTVRNYFIPFVPDLYAYSFSTGSGLQILQTAYNLALTPARMLLAHLNVLTAGLQKIHGNIKFVKGEGNTDLRVAKNDIGCQADFSGQVLSEHNDIAYDESLAANIAPLWLPETYTFDYPLTFSQFNAIRANPYGYVTFYKSATEKMHGYIINMDYKLMTGLTTFTLLRANV